MIASTTTHSGTALPVLNDFDRDRAIAEQYSAGLLSHFEVMTQLGFDNRWETDAWLADHGAALPYSLDDLKNDLASLNRILGPVAS
jgi:hypothetical protein